jgi:hypothetical protein
VVADLSSVQVITSTGAAIPVSKPVNDPSGQQIVTVRFRPALPPGTYVVIWHVVSIYQRPTSGTFHFTVSGTRNWRRGTDAGLGLFQAPHCNAKVVRYFFRNQSGHLDEGAR